MKYSSSNTEKSSNGIGIFTVLQIVFLVLKLTNLIDWSWWWVWSPTWISIVYVVIMLFIVCLMVAIDQRKWK